MNTINVLLVEEVRVLREMLTSLINAQPDLHVVGQIHDALAASRAHEFDPDVAVIGLMCREDERLKLIRSLHAVSPRTRIVVMDFRSTEEGMADFVTAGVQGFILQDTPTENMLHIIRIAAAGVPAQRGDAAVALPSNGARAFNGSNGSNGAHAVAAPLELLADLPVHLTKRETEITRLISQGRSNKEIARQLRLSLHTVKSHVRRIMEKLALHSRVQIAALAYGGLSLPPAFAAPRN